MHLVVCGGKEKHVRLKAREKVFIVLCGEGPMKMQPVYQIQDGEEYEFNLISIKFEYFIVYLKVHGYVCTVHLVVWGGICEYKGMPS